MAESRFDIQFAGALVPGAEASTVRERLRDLLRLSPETLERLFSGQPVLIKRNLDAATATRYRDAFRAAGAILRLTPSPDTAETPSAASEPGPQPAPQPAGDPGGLTLAPPGANVEEVVPVAPRDIDTAALSLVPGQNWTLEDCTAEPPPRPIPDISHLALVPAEPRAPRQARDLDE